MPAHPDSRPVMAVLCSKMAIIRLRKQITHPRIKLMVEANKEVNNTLYYFCLKQVDTEKRKIAGYSWNARHNTWVRGEFSFPDILYLRSDPRRKEEQLFDRMLKNVREAGGSVINYPKFNKWRLYQILNEEPAVSGYLPVTRAVEKPDDIQEMLQEYKTVYLKSQIGRKGRDVLRVEALSEECYRYCFFRRGILTDKTVHSFEDLLDAVNEFFGARSILIQEAIPLVKYENRLLDMRAELQRNGDGKLEIIGISVRQGIAGSPITTHSNAYKFDKFFTEKMGYSKRKLKTLQQEVEKFLFNVYESIEKYCGRYVEIGIDFSIDINRKIWLIEANSQSTKVSLEKSHDSEVLYRAYRNILEYAGYLYKARQGGVSD